MQIPADNPGPLSDFSLYGGAETVSPPHNLRRTRVADPNAPEPTRVPLDPNDFLWLMTEEPHRSRRAAILKAHPEVCHARVLSVEFCVLAIHCYRSQSSWAMNH